MERNREGPRLSNLTVEPVEGCVGGAVNTLGLAAVGSTTRSLNAVDVGDSDAATSVAEVEPVNGTSSFGASRGRGRGLDTVELLAEEELVDSVEVKGGNSSSIEVVVAEVRKRLAHTLNLDGGLRGEGISEGSSDTVLVEVKRNIASVENIRGERLPLVLRESSNALTGVQGSDIVEDSQSALGCGCSSGVSACVVLNTETKSDVLKSYALRRRGKFSGCIMLVTSSCISEETIDLPPPLRGRVGMGFPGLQLEPGP